MTKWDGTGKSDKEDDSINPFVSSDGGKPLSSSRKAERPAVAETAAEEPLDVPTEEPVTAPAEEARGDAAETPEEEIPKRETPEEETYIESEETEDDVPAEEPVTEPVPEPVAAEPARMDIKTGSNALKGMLSFFTAIPVSAGEGDIEAMNSNMWLAPVIGFIFALFASFAFLIGNLGDAVAGGVLALGTVMILNKFLHVDGLIDTGDAIAATGDTEKKRRAMKDPAIGAGGIAVAVLVVGGTLLFYSSYALFSLFFIFVALAEVCGRNSMVTAAAFGNHVGGGMASDSVERTGTDGVIKSTILTVVLALLAMLLGYAFAIVELGDFVPQLTANLAGRFFVIIIFAIIVSVVWGWAISKYANEKLGGVSGDVLGASVESGRLIAFIMISITVGLLALI
ncbi:MAG: adenosylcobinamide-GDP ribazoletransferase [Thermoplasmatales archaeon]|nr:adenosylcobinamide-GDP ribazoletransferase [Thermoplasmatales archaeon]